MRYTKENCTLILKSSKIGLVKNRLNDSTCELDIGVSYPTNDVRSKPIVPVDITFMRHHHCCNLENRREAWCQRDTCAV